MERETGEAEVDTVEAERAIGRATLVRARNEDIIKGVRGYVVGGWDQVGDSG